MEVTVQEITKQLNKLICFLEPVHSLLNSHFGSFFTEDLWNTHVPIQIQLELNNLNSLKNFIEIYPEIIKNNCPNDFSESHPNLLHFIKKSLSVSIINKEKYLKLSLDLENLFKVEDYFSNCNTKIKKFMSSKKFHEVEMTSRMTVFISDLTQSSHIIDVGGGKGYLSCSLALHYSFKVLGLDSSQMTTCGAIKRSEKVAKLWNGEISEHFTNSKCREELDSKKAREKFMQNHYKQVITFVKPGTNIIDFLKKSFNEEIRGITLTGLHTCGDLASTCLKIFVKNKEVKGIINIGCCYNHISEEFIKGDLENTVEGETENFGFPMSSFLRKKNYKLGRNARMLACYSLARINLNLESEFAQTSLFYRAVLDTVIRKMKSGLNQQKLGRFAKKCNSFHEYMFTALKKLGIDAQLTENDLDKLYKCYVDKKPLLTAFYLLRICLAPVVESIILLDRTLYLIENGINNVHLVQLFNLEISPRGFGIIAWKDFENK